jgi:two-component system sensor histidine kinase/response regulator
MPDAPTCILIVDGEASNRDLLQTILSPEHRTIEAASGPDALAALGRESVDLVLLDVMVPGSSGYEVCRQIKARATDAFLPVLLITAPSSQEERNLGWQAGADDFLSRPVDDRELTLRVRAFLRLRQQELVLKRIGELQAMKDELLALLVHDLRAPLCCIMAHVSFILDDVQEPHVRDDARSALEAAEAMCTELEDILRIRLLEDGGFPIAPGLVNLQQLVRGAVTMLEPIARRKQITVSTTVAGNPIASLDGKLVRRAVENLARNALEHTAEGQDVAIAVHHERETVTIEVADRGPGIPTELKAGTFERFGSVEAKNGGARKGFGLGLYMVKLVCDGHRGSAEVLDREGGGAVFRIRLHESA